MPIKKRYPLPFRHCRPIITNENTLAPGPCRPITTTAGKKQVNLPVPSRRCRPITAAQMQAAVPGTTARQAQPRKPRPKIRDESTLP